MRYGVDVPEQVTNAGLKYVIKELPDRIKSNDTHLAFILYSAYVITSFPKSDTSSDKRFELAQQWITAIDKYSGILTPYEKILAANIFWRLGNKEIAFNYLDQVMDSAREDAIASVYWTPEKHSWLWYNDSIEVHSFILRTLMLIRPQDPHIPGMVQWLLFNRKATEWKSTKATSAAVYALLDYIKLTGALDESDQYTVNWDTIKDT